MPKVKIAVLVSGGGTNLQTLIDSVENNYINGEIIAVISDRKGAYALERAEKHGIKAVLLDKKEYGNLIDFNNELISILKGMHAELVVLAGFLTILSSDFIKNFEGRIVNVHPSLIPAFCGAGFYGGRVHKAALEYGVKVSGATVHFVDEGTDTGSIILQEAVPVLDDDTPETLASRVLKVEHKILPKAVKLYCEGKLKLQGRRVIIEE